jgi:hypothetical protein
VARKRLSENAERIPHSRRSGNKKWSPDEVTLLGLPGVGRLLYF